MTPLVQRQVWNGHTKYLIVTEHSSVILNIYDDVQEFGGTAYIYSLYTEIGHRHQKGASTVLEMAERITAENSQKEVYLRWLADETPQFVADWYLRRGYKSVGPYPSTDLLLCKQLT